MARELVSLTGLDRDSPAFRLYQKAKRLGTWDPAAIDFSTDREQWPALTDAHSIWDVVEARLDELGPLALEVANETFAGYHPIPFDLPILVPYAAQQLQKRRTRIESARLGASPGELDIE